MAWHLSSPSLAWAAWPLRLLRFERRPENAVERLASQLAVQDHAQLSHLGWLDAGIWGRALRHSAAREALLKSVAVSGDEQG